MAGRAADGARSTERSHRVGATGFDALVAAYEAPISRYLSRLVGDPELARDLAQETFLSAYRATVVAGTEPANPGGWLYRIATNHAFAYFRRRRLVRWVSLSQFHGDSGPATAGPGDRAATEAAIAAALARLEAKDRACLLLGAAGFASPEIAGQLGCSPGAARTRLSRARAEFRRLYAGEDGDDQPTGH